ALEQATGEFVTVHDADDWSHPGKIHEQATHLDSHPDVMANTTRQARMTEDLMFFRRGQAGQYIFPNMSSLMFRRQPVMDTLGYWDAVRLDRKSTRLNSSHVSISYAVFCFKKKKY